MIYTSTSFVYRGKKILLLLLIMITISKTHWSQKNEVGLLLGGANYFGDIGFKISKTRPAFGIFFKKHNQKKISFLFYLKNLTITADDSDTPEGPRRWRNLRFKNNLTEISSSIQYNLIQKNDVRNKGKYNLKARINLHFGTSFFYHNPKGSIYGSSSWINLAPLETENIKYSLFGIGILNGASINFNYNNFNFGIQIDYTKTFTDYLDDISTVFMYPASQSEQTQIYANQSSLGDIPSEKEIYFQAGNIRGNPENKDGYMNIGVRISRDLYIKNAYHSNKKLYRKNSKKYSQKQFKAPKARILRASF